MVASIACVVRCRPRSRFWPSTTLAVALCLPGAASVHASPDDVNGKLEATMAQIQAQGMPDLPPAPEQRRHNGGGILGWLFGDDEDEPPPRDPRDGN